ncbi:MAG: ABC transporter permease [Chloroflexi bacterium]|nr:ABC transporter permease [Chloroflexota bacterium]
MIINLLRVAVAETRREFLRARTYWLEVVADQVLFTLGFLFLSGLFQLVAAGNYRADAQLASLVGFFIWRVADGCILRTADSISDDAQSGTLEQVWLSGISPHLILLARSLAILLYHTLRGLLLAVVLILILRLSPVFSPGVLLIFVLTQAGAFGVAFIIAGLHLIYKNVSSLTVAISTALLFLTGALAPLDNVSQLDILSRLLPLTIGIKLTRQLIVEGVSLATLWQQPDFYWLIVNTTFYAVVGWLVMGWGQRLAQRDGSLAHY